MGGGGTGCECLCTSGTRGAFAISAAIGRGGGGMDSRRDVAAAWTRAKGRGEGAMRGVRFLSGQRAPEDVWRRGGPGRALAHKSPGRPVFGQSARTGGFIRFDFRTVRNKIGH